jgi:hypothetical protein
MKTVGAICQAWGARVGLRVLDREVRGQVSARPARRPLGELFELLRERETALTRLRRQGIQTLDLVPGAMTAAVLNRYLALRHAGDR